MCNFVSVFCSQLSDNSISFFLLTYSLHTKVFRPWEQHSTSYHCIASWSSTKTAGSSKFELVFRHFSPPTSVCTTSKLTWATSWFQSWPQRWRNFCNLSLIGKIHRCTRRKSAWLRLFWLASFEAGFFFVVPFTQHICLIKSTVGSLC